MSASNDKTTYTSVRGIVFQLHVVPNYVVAQAGKELKYPSPPKWHNPDKDRDEENPMDPAYIEACEQIDYARSDLVVNTYLATGTSVEHMPSGVYPPESEEWTAPLRDPYIMAGHPLMIPENGLARYTAWLKLYALADRDIMELPNLISRFSGAVAEADVEAAAESFRSNEKRNPIKRVSPTEGTKP